MSPHLPLVVGLALSSVSCTTIALRQAQQKRAMPINEVQRAPQSLTGKGIADPNYDIYRFTGFLIPDEKPRRFDLWLPKIRSSRKAMIREVTSDGKMPYDGRTISTSIDLRYTSNMLLTDPEFRKTTNLAIGDSPTFKGKCVSVSLREGSALYHWDAKLSLEWVKRDKTDIKANNALYLVTVPLDAAGYVTGALIEGSVDDDFGLPD